MVHPSGKFTLKLFMTFDEGLGSKRQLCFYSLVLELFLCYILYLSDSILCPSIFAQFLLSCLSVEEKPGNYDDDCFEKLARQDHNVTFGAQGVVGLRTRKPIFCR